MDEFAIKVENVSKTFKLPHEKNSSIKSSFVNFYHKKKGYELQRALNDVSFEIKKGEFFGIVGRNGSGKSTLLKLLAGIYSPTKGQVHVRGTLTPFIELGVGFNPELTGRENVYLNGALLGFSRKEMQAMYKDIVDFAEIEKFMDQKLKNYSSGMQVRLAFSIAIRAESDILLIDEVLAVGDANFQSKCFEYFRTLKNSDRTVVFVSHDRGAVQQFCDRALLINDGLIVKNGKVNEVLAAYDDLNISQLEEKDEAQKTHPRRGNGTAEIIECRLLRNGKSSKSFLPNDEIEIIVKTKFKKDAQQPIYGLVINRVGESPIFATNTKLKKIKTADVKSGQTITTFYKFKNLLGNGRYQVSPAVASQDTLTMYDWRDQMAQFTNTGWDDNYIPVYLDHKLEVDYGS
ncbi:ABC transporter ATP-binding protein [Candidatus Saccharibacteria bacterium]|nr:ABC transporter ATP-binding protein [Candidatus Saccharibacteria bacterium]